MDLIFKWVMVLTLFYFLSVNGYHLVVMLFSLGESFLQKRKEENQNLEWDAQSEFSYPVSIIIPTFNHESSIVNVVQAVLKNQYPLFEVLVVDDGSTDETLPKLKHAFDLEEDSLSPLENLSTRPVQKIFVSKMFSYLRVIQKEKDGSHADSTNVGLNYARYRYVLILRDNTLVEKQALVKMMRPIFRNPRHVIGVGGFVGVANGLQIKDGEVRTYRYAKPLLILFQTLDGLRNDWMLRLGFSRGSFTLYLSRALSLFRKDVLLEVEGFQKEFHFDDLEMTFRLHQHFLSQKTPYSIVGLAEPLGWAEVPNTWKGLFQKRKLWQRDLTRCLRKYAGILFQKKLGAVGGRGLGYYFWVEGIGPWIEFLSYLFIPLGLALGIFGWWEVVAFGTVTMGLTTFVSMVSIDFFETVFSLFPFRDLLQLLGASFFEFFGYRPFLSWAKVRGMLEKKS